MLSKALEESKMGLDATLHLSDEGSTKENNLADRTKTSDDVGPKGKVPKAAQSTPDNLNEEQTMSSRSAPYIAPKVNDDERSTIQRSIVTNASIYHNAFAMIIMDIRLHGHCGRGGEGGCSKDTEEEIRRKGVMLDFILYKIEHISLV